MDVNNGMLSLNMDPKAPPDADNAIKALYHLLYALRLSVYF